MLRLYTAYNCIYNARSMVVMSDTRLPSDFRAFISDRRREPGEALVGLEERIYTYMYIHKTAKPHSQLYI